MAALKKILRLVLTFTVSLLEIPKLWEISMDADKNEYSKPLERRNLMPPVFTLGKIAENRAVRKDHFVSLSQEILPVTLALRLSAMRK